MIESQNESFLIKMFEDNKTFVMVNGVKKSTDKKYLLTADAVSENIELFAQILKERIWEFLIILTFRLKF